MLSLYFFLDYNITVKKKVEEGKDTYIELIVDYWNDKGNNVIIIRSKQFIQGKTFEKKGSYRCYLGGAKPREALGGTAVSELTGGRYSEGFHGCISFLKVRKRLPTWASYGSQVNIKTNKDNDNLISWDNVLCRDTCAWV